MKEVKYYRKRHTIKGPDGAKKYDSINLAKKASRELQLAEGGLGCGVLQVEK